MVWWTGAGSGLFLEFRNRFVSHKGKFKEKCSGRCVDLSLLLMSPRKRGFATSGGDPKEVTCWRVAGAGDACLCPPWRWWGKAGVYSGTGCWRGPYGTVGISLGRQRGRAAAHVNIFPSRVTNRLLTLARGRAEPALGGRRAGSQDLRVLRRCRAAAEPRHGAACSPCSGGTAGQAPGHALGRNAGAGQPGLATEPRGVPGVGV